MLITNDYSLAKTHLINKGFAEIDVHSIRFDRYFSDEEKEQNIKESEVLSKEQWNNRCDSTRERTAEKNKIIIDMLNSEAPTTLKGRGF